VKIVFASHSHMSRSLVVGSHHLAREFTALGHEVLHISTPVTLAHLPRSQSRERVAAWKRGVITHARDIREIVPLALLPWQLARYFGLNAYMRSVPQLKRQIREAGFGRTDLLLIDEPRMIGLCERLAPRQVIYRATDLYAAMRCDPSVEAAERETIRRSQALIGTAAPVLDHLRSFDREKPSLLVENGVDLAHFSQPRPVPALYRGLDRPRLLYVGALDRRFDFATVAALAKEAPDLRIILAGPVLVPVEPSVSSLANIHFAGPVPYQDVPALMQHADLGLLPLNDEPSNRGRSPMKLYEYAAAGLPVVARKTTELARRAEPFVHLYEDASGMLQRIRERLAVKTDREAIGERAEEQGWTGKARQILEFAEGVRMGTGRALAEV